MLHSLRHGEYTKQSTLRGWISSRPALLENRLGVL